jgi:hypothetical protein
MLILPRSTFFYILYLCKSLIPLLCLLVPICFKSPHNSLYAHIVIYICKYMHILLWGLPLQKWVTLTFLAFAFFIEKCAMIIPPRQQDMLSSAVFLRVVR